MKQLTPEVIRELVRQAVLESLAETPRGPLAAPPNRSESVGEAPSFLPQPAPPAYYAPWTGVSYQSHASQRILPIFVAGLSDPPITSSSSDPCILEQGQRCDDCGKCRSLGF